MKITPLVVICSTVLLIPILAGLLLLSAYPGEQPAWYNAYEAADKASTAGDRAEWNRQAQIVFADSNNYNGAMPPAEKMDWGLNLVEHALWWFPMQDRGVTTTYSEALRNLARRFDSDLRLDEAEKFLRKAYELEVAESKVHPKARRSPHSDELIALLEKVGKKDEAKKIQHAELAAYEARASENAADPNYRLGLLYRKAEVFERDGEIKDAEKCYKDIIDYYKDELTDDHLDQLKQTNNKGEPAGQGSYGLNVFTTLERLTEFYRRNKNLEGEEKTLARIAELRQATVWDCSPTIADDFDHLAVAYRKHKKYDLAEKAMKQSIAVLVSNKLRPNKSDTASGYIRLADILDLDGKKAEALKAREMAHKIDPSVTMSVRSGD